MSDPLLSVQQDITARLRGSDLLRDITTHDLRPRTEEDATAIVSIINQALAGLEGPNERSGLAILVPMPAFDIDRPDAPTPVGDIIVQAQILEKIMVNEGPLGTGITCEAAAWTVMRLGHHLMLRPNQLLYAARMRPLDVSAQEDWDADVAWEVEFRLRGGVDCLPAADIPLLTLNAGLISATTSTVDGTILITLDGSFPWVGNPNAAPYTAPFAAPPSGTSLRAVTHKAGIADSGAAELIIA